MSKNIIETKLIQTAKCTVNTYARPNPSLFIFPGISSKPVWNKNNFKSAQILENNYDTIKEEFIQVKENNKLLNDYSLIDNEKGLHKGMWNWYSYVTKGKENDAFKQNFPKTHNILMGLDDLMRDVPFAYTFFSSLDHNSEIDPHYGPCNIRVRLHLGIDIPNNEEDNSKDFVKVGNEVIEGVVDYSKNTRSKCRFDIGEYSYNWKNGRSFVFDDTYIHSVCNISGKTRVILLVDLWHPELQPLERKAIVDMFNNTKKI